MAHTIAGGAEGAFANAPGLPTSRASSPAYQGYQILHLAFVVAPLVAGFDKFFHVLTNWDQYLAPGIARLSPIGGHQLMLVVGVIEIIAGLLVAIRPRIGAWLVSAWLLAIVVNLLLIPGYYDIALRDFGLSLGALALARLSQQFDVEQRWGRKPGSGTVVTS